MTRTHHDLPKHITRREGRTSPFLVRIEGTSGKFFATLQDALAFRDAELARLGRCKEVLEGKAVSAHHPSLLKDDLALWFDRKRPDLTINGAASMKEAIVLSIIPRLGEVPTAELSHAKVLEVIGDLRRSLTYKGTPLKEKSIVNRLSPLQSFYDELFSEGVVASNPVKSAIAMARRQWKSSSKSDADRATRAKFLTLDEAARLLDACSEYGDRKKGALSSWTKGEMYHVVAFLLHTGLRVGEVAALLWGDFVRVNLLGDALRKPIVRVSKTMLRQTDSEGQHIVQAHTKGKVDREVSLNSACVSLLDRWKAESSGLGYSVGEEDPVFPIATRYSGFKSMYRRCAEQAGLPKTKHGVHSTRHGFATFLRASGASVVEIQKLLGHQDAATTQRYMDLTGIDVTDTTEALVARLPMSKVSASIGKGSPSPLGVPTLDQASGVAHLANDAGGSVIDFQDRVRKLRRDL